MKTNKSHSWSKHTQTQYCFWNPDSGQSWVIFMKTKLPGSFFSLQNLTPAQKHSSFDGISRTKVATWVEQWWGPLSWRTKLRRRLQQPLFGAKCNSVVMMIISSDPRLWFPLKSKLVVILATQFLSLPLVSAKIVLAAIPCEDAQTVQDRAQIPLKLCSQRRWSKLKHLWFRWPAAVCGVVLPGLPLQSSQRKRQQPCWPRHAVSSALCALEYLV